MVDTVKYVVKKDDSLWNIMKRNGFPPRDWRKALDATYNAAFKRKLKKERRSPDLIYEGEVFYLPRYNPAQLEDKILQLEHLYEAMGELGKSTRRLERTVQKLGKDRKTAEKALKEARKELARMDKIDDIRFKTQFSDDDDGLTLAKLFHQSRDKKRQDLVWQVRDLEGELRVYGSDSTRAKVSKLQKSIDRYAADLRGIEKQVRRARDELTRNLRSPY